MEEHIVMERKKKVFGLTCLICLILMGALLIMQFLPYWTVEESFMSQLEAKDLPKNYDGVGDYKISMWRYVAFPTNYTAVTKHFEKCYEDYYRESFDENVGDTYKKQVKAYDKANPETPIAEYSDAYYDVYFKTDYIVNEKAYLIDSIIVIPWGVILCLILGIVCMVAGLDIGVPVLSTVCGIFGVSKYISAYRGIGILTMNGLWWLHLAIFAIILLLGLWGLVNHLTSRYAIRRR